MTGYHHYKERKYEVGQQLLTLRRQTHLTQIELADLVAVSRRSIQNWEAGTAYPKEDGLQRLIKVFLDQGVFTPGQEREEVEALWALVSRDAPNSLTLFDAVWFDRIRGQGLGAGGREGPVSTRPPAPDPRPLLDWGEAIDVPVLYGRETELATLQEWVVRDRCRVVMLLGLGGIGKTSLALSFAQQAASQFESVFFRSLRNAPPLSSVLDGLIRVVSTQQALPPDSVSDKIGRLVELLRERRCLLVLDNLEAIIQPGAPTDDYRPGYADYGLLIQHLGQAVHHGCLLLTSREKPDELGLLESRNGPVRTLALTGLAEPACQMILAEKELVGEAQVYAALTRLYGGNPLALKLVSEPIRELFGGNVSAFLASGDAFFNGVGKLLEQQFSRSAVLEQAVLYWLTIARELVSLEELVANLGGMARQREVLQTLESLRRRLLIEQGQISREGSVSRPAFTLQPVIMEYLTDRLIEQMSREIREGHPDLLCSHALVQATARDYVRQTQERLIATPLLEQVVVLYGGLEAAERRLYEFLLGWRGRPETEQGYGPGNVINLLRLLRGDLRGLDFSELAIRQAYLQQVEAQDVSLAGAQMSQVVLAEAFTYSICVALRADGQYLVAGTSNGEIRLWRVADRTPILAFEAHPGGVYGIAYSANGRLIASGGGNGELRLWDGAGGTSLATLSGHTGGIWGVAISADGQLLASGSGLNGEIRLWDTASGVCRAVLAGHTEGVYGLALSGDARLLVSGSFDQTVRLWDVERQECLATLSGHTGGVWGVAVNADGRRAASGAFDGTIRVWDTSTLQPGSEQAVLSGDAARDKTVTVLHGHTGGVYGVSLSADGQLLASSGTDGTVRLWDTTSGTGLAIFQGHRGAVYSVALDSRGQLLASSGMEGTIQLWEVKGQRQHTLLHGYSGMMFSVALSTDGQWVASGGMDGAVRVWEVETGRPVATLRGHSGAVYSVAWSADNRLLASSGPDGTARVWDISNGQCLAVLQGHWGVALSKEGQLLVSGGAEGTLWLWDTSAMHPSSGHAVLRASMTVGTSLASWPGHAGMVRDVALSGDGRLIASAAMDGLVRLWEVEGQRPGPTLSGHNGAVYSVALSTDGQVAASGGHDGSIRLWDTASGRSLAVLQGHTSMVFGVALSADGRLVASSSPDGTVQLWDVSTATQLKVLEGHSGMVRDVALSADGRMVASAGADGTVRLWSTENGRALWTLRPDRPYERMNITGLTGVTEAQRTALLALGAVA